jgi:hypothetical protein
VDDLSQLVAELMPYLTAVAGAYGRRVFDRIRDESADAAADATVGLGRRLLRRLMGTPLAPQIEAAVTAVTNHPDDEDVVAGLRAPLKLALSNDAGLAAELAELVKTATGVVTVTASGERSVAAQHNTGVISTGDHAEIQR